MLVKPMAQWYVLPEGNSINLIRLPYQYQKQYTAKITTVLPEKAINKIREQNNQERSGLRGTNVAKIGKAIGKTAISVKGVGLTTLAAKGVLGVIGVGAGIIALGAVGLGIRRMLQNIDSGWGFGGIRVGNDTQINIAGEITLPTIFDLESESRWQRTERTVRGIEIYIPSGGDGGARERILADELARQVELEQISLNIALEILQTFLGLVSEAQARMLMWRAEVQRLNWSRPPFGDPAFLSWQIQFNLANMNYNMATNDYIRHNGTVNTIRNNIARHNADLALAIDQHRLAQSAAMIAQTRTSFNISAFSSPISQRQSSRDVDELRELNRNIGSQIRNNTISFANQIVQRQNEYNRNVLEFDRQITNNIISQSQTNFLNSQERFRNSFDIIQNSILEQRNLEIQRIDDFNNHIGEQHIVISNIRERTENIVNQPFNLPTQQNQTSSSYRFVEPFANRGVSFRDLQRRVFGGIGVNQDTPNRTFQSDTTFTQSLGINFLPTKIGGAIDTAVVAINDISANLTGRPIINITQGNVPTVSGADVLNTSLMTRPEVEPRLSDGIWGNQILSLLPEATNRAVNVLGGAVSSFVTTPINVARAWNSMDVGRDVRSAISETRGWVYDLRRQQNVRNGQSENFTNNISFNFNAPQQTINTPILTPQMNRLHLSSTQSYISTISQMIRPPIFRTTNIQPIQVPNIRLSIPEIDISITQQLSERGGIRGEPENSGRNPWNFRFPRLRIVTRQVPSIRYIDDWRRYRIGGRRGNSPFISSGEIS